MVRILLPVLFAAGCSVPAATSPSAASSATVSDAVQDRIERRLAARPQAGVTVSAALETEPTPGS